MGTSSEMTGAQLIKKERLISIDKIGKNIDKINESNQRKPSPPTLYNGLS
jgi:hypothetical protein